MLFEDPRSYDPRMDSEVSNLGRDRCSIFVIIVCFPMDGSVEACGDKLGLEFGVFIRRGGGEELGIYWVERVYEGIKGGGPEDAGRCCWC